MGRRLSPIFLFNKLRVRTLSSGFTLLEVMAVMFIIAMMVALIPVNFSGNQREQSVIQEAEKWSVVFELLAQEAVLSSQDFGVIFHTNGVGFYRHMPLTLDEIEEMRQSVSQKKPRHEWEPYEQKPFKFRALPETIVLEAIVEGQAATLQPPQYTEKAVDVRDDEEPEPQWLFLSGGEQQPVTITLQWRGEDADEDPLETSVQVIGDGLGRFSVKVVRDNA